MVLEFLEEICITVFNIFILEREKDRSLRWRKEDQEAKLNYTIHHCPQHIHLCHSVSVKIYSRYYLFEGVQVLENTS